MKKMQKVCKQGRDDTKVTVNKQSFFTHFFKNVF